MKILIINPWIFDTTAYDFWLKPLGLIYIANILKKNNHEVKFIDLLDRKDNDLIKKHNIKDRKYSTGKFHTLKIEKPKIINNIPRDFKLYGLPIEYFEKKLLGYEPDIILIGVTITYWYYGAIKTIEILRKFYPNKKIYLGGIYSNLYPNHSRETFNKYNVKIINGIGIDPVNQILLENKQRRIDCNLFQDNILDYSVYESSLKYGVFISSVGCPCKCTYCITPRMWRYETVKEDIIIESIENLIKFHPNIEDIVFFDDAFLLRKNLYNLLNNLSKYNIRFHLPNGIHAKILTQEISDLLLKANFKIIKLGYETYDEKVQSITGNKVNNIDLLNAVRYFKNSGFNLKDIGAYVLLNLPNQTYEEVFRSIDYCLDLGINVNLNEFTFIPGTKVYDDFIIKNNYNTDPLLMNKAVIPYWFKEGMKIDDIIKIKNYLSLKKRKEVEDNG